MFYLTLILTAILFILIFKLLSLMLVYLLCVKATWQVHRGKQIICYIICVDRTLSQDLPISLVTMSRGGLDGIVMASQWYDTFFALQFTAIQLLISSFCRICLICLICYVTVFLSFHRSMKLIRSWVSRSVITINDLAGLKFGISVTILFTWTLYRCICFAKRIGRDLKFFQLLS